MLIRCQFIRQNTRVFKQTVVIYAFTDRNVQMTAFTAICLLDPFDMKRILQRHVTFRAVRVVTDGNYGREELCSSVW